MSKTTEYRRMYPDLPEPVFEPLKFTRYPERQMIQRAKDAMVPKLKRKTLEEVIQWNKDRD